jgi:hypothetical protein
MTAAVVAAAGTWPGTTAEGGRFESFTQKAAQGEKMRVVAATYFGGAGIDEFVAAGSLADGTIVAFGNSWGPDFPTAPAPVVLGKGQHRNLNPFGPPDRKGVRRLRRDNPDMAGMIVFYRERLQEIRRVVRFDWGVASISAGTVGPDGGSLYIAGRCTEAFREVAKSARLLKLEPLPAATPGDAAPDGRAARRSAAAAVGPYEYDGLRCPGDVFVARFSAGAERLDWVWILEGRRAAPAQIWVDKRGAVYADIRGLVRIDGDGQTLTTVSTRTASNTAKYLAVDPEDGSSFYGGDRNTNTGRQPWRQPYLYKLDPAGNLVWRLWEHNPRECACGGGGNGLCSDSSPRAMLIAPNGDYIVSGWSDGGNSVFTRHPTDWRKPGARSEFGMTSAGMKNANSISHLMRIDPVRFDLKSYNVWVAYIPDNFESARERGAPNFTSIGQLAMLPGGAVGFSGAAATGLIQTPNAFYNHPGDGRKSGGPYIAVFSADFRSLLFSSHMPGCEDIALGAARNGMIAVSRSRGGNSDPSNPTASPVVNALQSQKRGEFDAHIVVLELPGQ